MMHLKWTGKALSDFARLYDFFALGQQACRSACSSVINARPIAAA